MQLSYFNLNNTIHLQERDTALIKDYRDRKKTSQCQLADLRKLAI